MRVAVVGGGFGGVYAIKLLQRWSAATITLFEPNERFVFTPLLHEVAVGALHPNAVTHVYTDIFRQQITHVKERVTHIDVYKKRLTVGKNNYSFDYIIISPGAKAHLPKQPVHKLKTIPDALEIKQTIENNVRDAIAKNDPTLLTCVLVGAGPTGVELAAELVDFYKQQITNQQSTLTPKITLLEGYPTILYDTDTRVQNIALAKLKKKGVIVHTSAFVENITNAGVRAKVHDTQKTFTAACIIWTAGVQPHDVASTVEKKEGHFRVDETLQLHDVPYAFAIGDAALLPTPVPKLAQVAVQQGAHAAKNILRVHKGKPGKPFVFNDKGFLVSLGHGYAAGVVKGLCIKGMFAWILWRTVYLSKFSGVRSKLRIAKEYTKNLFTW